MKKWIWENRTGFFLMVTAVALIGVGIFRSEVNVVFQKASAICLECIGIG